MNAHFLKYYLRAIIFCSLFCLSFADLSAQNISVKSFRLLETDLTANTAGTMKRDQNNEVAALIKIVTTETGFSFEGSSLDLSQPSRLRARYGFMYRENHGKLL